MATNVDLAAGEPSKAAEPARPRLITLAMIALYFWVIMAVIIGVPFIFLALNQPVTGYGDAGSATGARVLIIGVAFFLLSIALPIVAAEPVRRGLWWSREAMFGLIVLYLLIVPVAAKSQFDERVHGSLSVPSVFDLAFVVALGVLAFWYFYRKPNVKAYYDYLRKEHAPSA